MCCIGCRLQQQEVSKAAAAAANCLCDAWKPSHFPMLPSVSSLALCCSFTMMALKVARVERDCKFVMLQRCCLPTRPTGSWPCWATQHQALSQTTKLTSACSGLGKGGHDYPTAFERQAICILKRLQQTAGLWESAAADCLNLWQCMAHLNMALEVGSMYSASSRLSPWWVGCGKGVCRFKAARLAVQALLCWSLGLLDCLLA